MAIAIAKRSTPAYGTAVDTLASSFSSLPSAGSNIIVLAWDWPESAAWTSGQVTDNQGNTYTLAAASTANNGQQCGVWYAENIGSPSGTFTATLDPVSTGDYPNLIALEVTGLATSSSFDQTNTATGNSTAPNSGSITPSQADELVIGVACTGGTVASIAAAGGWTEEIEQLDSNNHQSGEGDSQIVASTSALSASWTLPGTNQWSALIVSFKAAAAAASPFPPFPLRTIVVPRTA